MRYMIYFKPLFLSLIFVVAGCATLSAQQQTGPRVLVVVAHPDDETAAAATIYKITHELNGLVDQCVITNGEGGYKYSTLAESYYGLELTDEAVGRANLPRIRKQELMNAGKIIGTHNIFFLDQKDAHYGLDEHEPLDTSWNVAWISTRLKEILNENHYDFVFCLLPVPGTHGGHKAATLLALKAVQQMPQTVRPIVLGMTASSKSDTASTVFEQLKDYKETKILKEAPVFAFDKSKPFGYNNKLTYKIIVNWEIAEHKSQGTMQLAMNMGDYENYWYFALNGPEGVGKCKALFEQLKSIPYKTKVY
jgi:LmbE family N-acetylglucosaminyl deacetylase